MSNIFFLFFIQVFHTQRQIATLTLNVPGLVCNGSKMTCFQSSSEITLRNKQGLKKIQNKLISNSAV